MPGVIHTGARTAPCGDVRSRMSPLASCHLAAVSGWTSTQACQVIFETGSGSSWSHGLLAPRPSCSATEGNTVSTGRPGRARELGEPARVRPEPHRLGRRLPVDAAVLQRVGPKRLEVLAAAEARV